MPICGILGCFTRHGVRKDLRFFKTPKIIKDQGEETLKLSEERRRLWKAAVGRKDIKTEEKWERTIVCSQHFVGGKFRTYYLFYLSLKIFYPWQAERRGRGWWGADGSQHVKGPVRTVLSLIL